MRQMKEYLIGFSSFHRASYAQEKLAEQGFQPEMKRIPPKLLDSCGYALYLQTDSVAEAVDVLEACGITARAVYRIDYEGGAAHYRQIR